MSQEWELLKRPGCHTGRAEEEAKLGGGADIPEGCAANQRALITLQKWADKDLMKINRGKYNVLRQVENNLLNKYRLRAVWQETSSTERDLGILVGTKLTMSQQYTLMAKLVNSILGCKRGSTGETYLKWWVQVRGPQHMGNRDTQEWAQWKVKKVMKGLEDLSWSKSQNCSAWRREGMKREQVFSCRYSVTEQEAVGVN